MKQLTFTQKVIDNPISCQGVTIRTTNADEMTAGQESSTAKIGGLWQDFQQQFCDVIDETTQVFGVYHHYESDVNGAFDVSACIAKKAVSDNTIENEITKNSVKSVPISAGNYLVFRQQGSMPQAVIDAWGEVWAYFTSDTCQHVRQYDTDFEKYIGMDAVEVYVGIK